MCASHDETVGPKSIRIGDREIGDEQPCYIIAEAGVNHNGSLALAKQLVDVAVECGVDAVKFQKRNMGHLYDDALLLDKRGAEQGTQYLMGVLQEFELAEEEFEELAAYCTAAGITFLCTGWDADSIDVLNRLGVPAFKLASADMTNLLLLEHIAQKGKPMLVSTGMSTVEEIQQTTRFLNGLGAEYILLHCNSTYPAPFSDLNLRFLTTLRQMSGRPVGYSGHEQGIAISTAAVALGACVIERHITLDRTMRGPDHAASLEKPGFAKLVRDIRHLEEALGSKLRFMSRGELLNRQALGKSLVAARDIGVGETITRDMVSAKSPGRGLNPQHLPELIGRETVRALARDEAFTTHDLGRAELEESAPFPPGWGLVVRPTDLDVLLAHEPALVEVHLSDRDLDAGVSWAHGRTFSQQLVVHAPEYFYDHLIDLCSTNPEIRAQSVQRIQQTLDYTAALAPHFTGSWAEEPAVVVHIGGMSRDATHFDLERAEARILEGLAQLRPSGVRLLVENMPPLAWYFGGQWFQHAMTDAEHVTRVCSQSGYDLCFDTSHAALYCAHAHLDLFQYTETLRPFIRHLHVADAAGVSGEGLQIGEGSIPFGKLLPDLLRQVQTVTLEIWQGHHHAGAGFARAMARLGTIPELQPFTTPAASEAGVRSGVARGIVSGRI